MKQFLRPRDCYTQIICIFKSLKIPHSSLFAVLTIMCLEARAQSPDYSGAVPPGKLNIGDTIPEYLWHLPLQVVNHPDGKETITLGDYRRKLIILDFWATWCSACIGNFPTVAQMQRTFENDLATLLVTYEPKNKALQTLQGRNRSPQTNLTSIVEDSIFQQLFEHKLIPHYVWISAKGVVKATTSTAAITVENIRNAIADENIDAAYKIDMDLAKPLFSSEWLPTQNLKHYAILINGRIEGTGSGTKPRVQNGRTTGFLFTNTSLLKLYEYCFRGIDKRYRFADLNVSVKNPEYLIREKSTLPLKEWYRRFGYSFDFIIPEERADSLYDHMLNTLNTVSPYVGSVKEVEEICLVLRPICDQKDFVYTQGDRQIQVANNQLMLNNVPMHYLIEKLNTEFSFGKRIVDSTNYQGKIHVEFSNEIHSLAGLKKELRKHGLSLTKERIRVHTFTINDKP